jgi:serine/threonine protein kinase
MLSPGVALGHRYELEERVGAGGFSDVWRARDLTLDRTVAVKVLHVAYVQDAEALARFRAEARHAGSLAHENIARVYDYDELHPPYLVMELVDGPSLAQALASGPMDPVRAMDVVAQAATGLQAAHEAGLVHRDIKPGNLLLAPDGIVKITDFGISHAVGSAGVTSTGLVVGTPGYLAPERVAGAGATALSDLYSLGVVAYECLAGAAPFDGTALEVAVAHASRPFPALPAFVPADVGALVAHLTAKNPADRPGSAAEVARRARQLGDRLVSTSSLVANQSVGLPGPAGEPQPADRSAALVAHFRRPRRSAVIGGAAAALIALVVLVGVKIGDPEPGNHPAAASSSSAARPVPSATRPKTPTAVTIDVNIDSLLGQPVDIVANRLRQQGLIPRILWQRSKQQQPGRVTAIWPTGQRPAGSVVTVVGALRGPVTAAPSPPQASTPDGNGNGKGKGKGKGNGLHLLNSLDPSYRGVTALLACPGDQPDSLIGPCASASTALRGR